MKSPVGTFGSAGLNISSPPLVGILMGSDSDLTVMQDAAKVLEELGISSEVHVLSAHRTPQAVVEFAVAPSNPSIAFKTISLIFFPLTEIFAFIPTR